MAYIRIVFSLLACCAVLKSSASLISDNPDVDGHCDKQLRHHPPSHPANSEANSECQACILVVVTVKTLVELHRSEEEIIQVAIRICELIEHMYKYVCSALVPEFKNEVFSVLMSIESDDICGAIVPGCGHYNPLNQNWTVSFPDKPKPPVEPLPPPKQDNPIRILHLSDIHVDLLYKEGLTTTECGAPLCCRPPNEPISPAAGPWGDYHCDVPMATVNELFKHLADIKDQFDVVYWTGDLPAHNIWDQTREDQMGILHNVTTLMASYLENKKVYPTLGNHESAPVNSFPPPFITGKSSNQWLLDAYQTDFSRWLPSNTASTIKKGGYYSTKLVQGLKLISLNMNYCNTQNWWLLINSTDPAGQLQWLINELQESEDDGEKVHIIGHIGPGSRDCMQVWKWNYYRIMNRYEATIVGQFFGHSHFDEFEIFYDMVNSSRAISVAYLGPSVTPYKCNNPSYRIYKIESLHENSAFQVLDHYTYFTNLTEANNNNNLTWQFEYSAKEAYNLDNLHPQEWSSFVDRMEKDDSLFALFHKYFYRREIIDCGRDCKEIILCALKPDWSHDCPKPNHGKDVC